MKCADSDISLFAVEDVIRFGTSSQLTRRLDRGDFVVPGRKQGRRSMHREEHCLRIYLQKTGTSFTYPLSIKRAKPPEPDFLINQSNNLTIGLEVTEATSEEYQELLTEVEGTNGSVILDMKPNIVQRGEDYEYDPKKDGWVGDGPKKAAAGLIFDAICKKVEKLRTYKGGDVYQLLVYCNLPVPIPDIQKVVKMVAPHISEDSYEKIFLIDDRNIYFL